MKKSLTMTIECRGNEEVNTMTLQEAYEKDRNKQHRRIADFIIDNHGITGKDAAECLGIMSFTKRISEMNALGYPLIYEWEESKNRYGERVRYKRWYFV